MNSIGLHEFPDVPQLVAEVVNRTGRVPFGYRVMPDAAFWEQKSEQEAKRDRPRDLLVDRMIAAAGERLTDASRQNLEALRSPTTLAVVTGQQVGLAGGPLLTLYKALTTIALARKMESESGVRTVPIFWMATSDHNLAEAAQVHWIDLHNRLAGYKAAQQDNHIPVGGISLGPIATEMLSAVRRDMPESEFKQDMLNALEECYTPKSTFTEAFRSLAYTLLGELGVVLFDPEDEQVKRASRPFWEDTVRDIDRLLAMMVDRSEEIRHAGYPLQAMVEPGRPALFVHEDGMRRKVVLEGKQIRARSDIILTHDELKKIAGESPESLSAGVTLRPLQQGWLLPTAAYVAGPHEMAYWSQLNTAFESAVIPAPAVVPRASLTLIENKVRRSLDKFELEPFEFFGDIEKLKERLVADQSEEHANQAFDTVDTHLMEAEQVLLALVEQPEFGGLDNLVSSAYRKIRYHVDKMREKVKDRLHQRHGDTLAHIEKLSTHIFPAARPQERVITPIYFFIRYGTKLLPALEERILEAVGRHVFFDVEELIDES